MDLWNLIIIKLLQILFKIIMELKFLEVQSKAFQLSKSLQFFFNLEYID